MSDEWDRVVEIRSAINGVVESLDLTTEAIQRLDVSDRHDLAMRIFLQLVGNAALLQGVIQPITRHKVIDMAYELAEQFLKKQSEEYSKQEKKAVDALEAS